MPEVVVVPHTHWDREWYRPFQAYRLRLVEAMRRILDYLEQGVLPYFLLDGQTIMLDDHLEIHPEDEPRIRDLVVAGRLGIGPWYILPDEFLVSGESIVRNLLFGRERMKRFGASKAIGYLPDMFGHTAQMPLILRGFGMDRALVWRGVDPPQEHFFWQDLSGDGVATVFLPTGYCNLHLWQPMDASDRQAKHADFIKAHKQGGPYLLLSGCDHLAPNKDLEAICAALGAKLGRIEDALPPAGRRDLPVVKGELRQLGRAYLLPDVASARMPLKQANVEVQDLWERSVEPLMALQVVAGASPAMGFWREGWELILKNQPHDSICGCSVDEVHREMQARFSQARNLGATLIDRALDFFSPKSPAPGLIAYNPSGSARGGWIEVVVEAPGVEMPTSKPEEVPVLVGADQSDRDPQTPAPSGNDAFAAALMGVTEPPSPVASPTLYLQGAWTSAHLDGVPSVFLGAEDGREFHADIDYHPDWKPVRRYRMLAYMPKMAPFGLETFSLTEGPGDSGEAPADVTSTEHAIENSYLKIEVKESQIRLIHKETGAEVQDLLRFVDGGDGGDEYTYSPPLEDRMKLSTPKDYDVVDTSAVRAVLEVVHHLNIPAALSPDRKRRAMLQIATTLKTRITLWAGSRTVDFETSFDNWAQDHRLRVLVGTGITGPEHIASEAAFGAVERQVGHGLGKLPVAPLAEAVPPTFPHLGWVAVEGRSHAAQFITRGLPEAEVVQGGQYVALTLLRCVGWLSRDDLRTRGGGAGPELPTPDAQMEGPHAFCYAVRFAPPGMQGRRAWWDALHEIDHWRQPIRTRSTGGHRAPLAHGNAVPFPLVAPPAAVLHSAFKPASDGKGVVLRVFNPTLEPSPFPVAAWPGWSCRPCDLAEEPCGEPATACDVQVDPGTVLSFRLEPTGV